MEDIYSRINKKRNILIIEDEYINIEILKNILVNNYNVFTATDGETALKIIKENNNISLILLDLNIPKISGIKVLEKIKKDYDEIPVIVLTSDKEQEVKCLNLGASDFIPKPYPQSSIIIARIERTIELYEDRILINYTERDKMTKLYTKEFFYKYIMDYDIINKNSQMDALIVGIRSFNLIKERFGIEYSQKILIELSKRIKKVLKEINGIACRLETQFLIYCIHKDDYSKLLESLSNEFYIDKIHKSSIKLQMGIYYKVDKSINVEVRFDRARMAFDEISNSILKTIGIYDEKIKEKVLFEEELINDLPKAIDEKQFKIYYQPKYNIQGNVKKLVSAEALVRWNHPKYGLISPAIFINLFEEKGLINLVDNYVWNEVGKQIKTWKEKYNYYIPVSVNVSRIDLFDPNLINILKNIITKNDINYSDILLEITESACANDINYIIGKINELRNLGFKIEMDDFGSGYSSLSMISKMPIDAIKLDMIFIKNAFENKNNNKMIEIIIEIASYLNVPTIAEGVETKEQLDALIKLGCDVVQGYYFSKPIPIDEFDNFLINKKIID